MTGQGCSVSSTGRQPALVPYDEALARYEPVIGLETHVELGTNTKMFCGCPTDVRRRAEHPGLPGLPGPARLAAGGQQGRDRVHHPDRPGAELLHRRRGAASPGRTTSIRTCRRTSRSRQYDEPLCFDGYLDVEVDGEAGPGRHRAGAPGGGHRQVAARRRRHRPDPRRDYSLVDYNRAGIPLVEIVTKPIPGHRRARAGGRPRRTSPSCATCCARWASPTSGWRRARCAATSTPRSSLPGAEWGTRTETKNVNSLRSVERAVRSEIQRQAAVLDAGERVIQETRHFHEDDREHHRRAGPRRRRRTTGTSRSRTWCRSRRRGRGSSRAAGRAAGAAPAAPRAGCRPSGACPTWTCSRCSTPAPST